MPRIAFFLHLFIISGCGLVDVPDHDSRFDAVLAQFRSDAAFFGVEPDNEDIVITFQDPSEPIRIMGFKNPFNSSLEESAEASCSVFESTFGLADGFFQMLDPETHGLKLVRVDPNLEGADPEFLEALVYHELGHCLLERDHREQVSVMGTNSNAIAELGPFRYFYLKSFYADEDPYIPENVYSCPYAEIDEDLDLIFSTDYDLFGERILYNLYVDRFTEDYCVDQQIDDQNL